MHQPRIFIWQGAWQGGAESVLLDIATFIRDERGIQPVLGVFKGEKDESRGFEQIEVSRIFPKNLVAYNQIAASLLLGSRLNQFDLVITHCGGFWKRPNNFFMYREPGDLDAMLRSLFVKSRILYWLPYQIALSSLKKGADLPVAASKRAADFLARHKIKNFLTTSNFIQVQKLPPILPRHYRVGERFKIVFIGRDDKLKRLDLLKQAVLALNDPDIELHIFGVERDGTSNIKYRGWQSEKAVREYLANEAHLFVLPSLFEASPLSLLIALSLGVPSLVSDNALPIEYQSVVPSFNNLSGLADKIQEIKDNYLLWSKRFIDFAPTVRREYETSKVLGVEIDRILKLMQETQ